MRNKKLNYSVYELLKYLRHFYSRTCPVVLSEAHKEFVSFLNKTSILWFSAFETTPVPHIATIRFLPYFTIYTLGVPLQRTI